MASVIPKWYLVLRTGRKATKSEMEMRAGVNRLSGEGINIVSVKSVSWPRRTRRGITKFLTEQKQGFHPEFLAFCALG